MDNQETLPQLLQRIRAGDQQAAAELVHRYEDVIRREVRLRLDDPRMGRLVDSLDICQSVLASFFVKAAVGRDDLEQPGQLIALLVAMARNKVVSLRRKHRAKRRDVSRQAQAGVEEIDPLGSQPTPSRIVEGQELLQEVQKRLNPEERRIVELRTQGRTWAEVASQLGGTADGRRLQFARAIDRVEQQLGLNSEG